MAKPIKLTPQLTRISSHFKKFDIEVPKGLLEQKAKKPDLSDFPYPLPQKKKDYTCFCEGDKGVFWYGSNGGVTRYDPNAKSIYDVMMYFSAPRDLLDNNVSALLADGDGVWALTQNGVTHIQMIKMSMEEKAYRLLEETLTVVERHGMVSQRHLSEGRNLKSAVPYGHSDNDGTFSASYAMGEIFHYVTLKKEKGDYAKETLDAREIAMRASEATLLLMYVAGRGDGFVARTYVTSSEPVPDDGLFYTKNGATAVCNNTDAARRRGVVGIEVKADEPIPERLAKLYTDEGYDHTDITYKGDTSSDEITHHFLHILVAHEFLGCEDPEYDLLLKTAARNTMNHIIDNGFVLRECDGKPTTWAKWCEEYFNTGMGWSDACLNAGQLLMYLKITMHVTGEKDGKFKDTYDMLVNEKGYDKLTVKHFDRFHQQCLAADIDDREDLMYGDHALAVTSLWGLITLEDDPQQKELFRKAFRTWRYTLRPEYNPGYDFLYFLSDPDFEEPDEERIKTWFYRFNPSRLASGVSMDKRRDYPVITYPGGYKGLSALPTNDERFIAKYDRDPLAYRNEDSGGIFCVESCYVFTFAYWVGRYFGFIEEGDEE